MENYQEKPIKFFTPFTILNVIIFVLAIASSFYFFYYKKNFNFIVEIPCDSQKEECFLRDCSLPDNCPPNQLSSFKRYTVKAKDFQNYCQQDDCTLACENKQINCQTIKCQEDEEIGESCSLPIE